ncbi:uncharacterized protein LOC128278459 [Anopheles cruzii]|uniref:uncharacterized protein LOC128278459 n=1 Tax=Anopheles cruzii TaxID=68878 RepID=UPI0022EC35D2|nr:uncharacterized protein LOC128278459 [Anopheles cruzii]
MTENGASQTSVPYGRFENLSSTADLGNYERNAEGRNPTVEINGDRHAKGYRSVASSVAMGAGEPEATSAEQEELFAQYRDDRSDLPVAQEDQQMDRNKRNVENRPLDRGGAFGRRLLLVNVMVNGLMFAVTGFITYHCFNKAMVLFSWHPTFMTTGYLILMSQAVLTMSGENYFTHRFTYRTRVFAHWILQAVAGILITIAAVCIFLNKIRLGKSHFKTLHGIFGLVTVCVTLVTILGGVTTKYAFQLRSVVRPIYSKLMHGIAGSVAYLLGMVTISLGVYSVWFQEDNDANVRLMLVIAIALIALYVIVTPMLNTVQRIKTAVRTTI